jgi:cytidine deaminase
MTFMANLSENDLKLIEEAKRVAVAFSGKYKQWRNEDISTVGAVAEMNDGSIFSGPNIWHALSSASCLCGEQVALAKAYSEGHTIAKTVAVYRYWPGETEGLLPPCGRCRDFLRLFGNPWILLEIDGKISKVKLDELLPVQYL